MAGSFIDHEIWNSIIDLDLNPDAGIYRYWRSLRAAKPSLYLGAPTTPEIDLGDGHVQQAFSSGAVIDWSPEGGAQLANDPL